MFRVELLCDGKVGVLSTAPTAETGGQVKNTKIRRSFMTVISAAASAAAIIIPIATIAIM